MVSGKTIRDPLSPGLRAVMLLPLFPIAVLVFVMLVAQEGTRPWEYVLNGLLFGSTAIFALWMHAFLTVRADSVRIGFMPFFWRTIPLREIADVEAVDVDPMRDYRGWGIKGRSRQPKGMLLSGGSHRAVRLTLRDGRRYLVTSPDSVDGIVDDIRFRIGQDAPVSGPAPA